MMTKRSKNVPFVSIVILCLIVLCCVFAGIIAKKDPGYLDLLNCNKAPNKEFWFGTDSLGRDLFADIWYGGRVSLTIGFTATLIATGIAILYGAISGLASAKIDSLLMRITEIILSVPNLLIIVFLQAILGQATVFSISAVIGFTSWCSIAKVVRTEVRQIRNSEYVIASKSMGGGFFHILLQHLLPNFISSIMFMVVMNVRSAIVAESTLSFMGLGLPIDVISWGSMLSLSNKAFMTKSWWVIFVPGLFLIGLLLCLTNIGNWIRREGNPKDSNL